MTPEQVDDIPALIADLRNWAAQELGATAVGAGILDMAADTITQLQEQLAAKPDLMAASDMRIQINILKNENKALEAQNANYKEQIKAMVDKVLKK